jgi:hypothetical protein
MLSPMEGFPSLAAEIGGSGISSRWWSHARANDIYNAFRDLSEKKDILTTKLIDGKVTLVHQDLWPSVVRLALDREWRGRQVRSLNQIIEHSLRYGGKDGSGKVGFPSTRLAQWAEGS